MILPNTRLNLIAVDTRNARVTNTLQKITSLYQVEVKAYEPGPRLPAVGIIKGVDRDITDPQLVTEMSADLTRILHARRLGSSSVAKI